LDLQGVPASVRTSWDVTDLIRRARLSDRDFLAFQRSRPMQDLFIRRFRAAGGTIAAGTDTPNQLLAPGASLHDEIALLVSAGLSTQEALIAATSAGGQLVRADSIGVLRDGVVADFVVLAANPLQDITNTRRIELVVRRGVPSTPADLKARW